MKTALLSLVALTLLVGVCHAQKVGDSEQFVITHLGNPPISRNSGDRQIWMYPNGTKVVLKGGVVVEVKIGAPNPTAPSEEAALREEARKVTAPQTNVYQAVAPAPASDRPNPTTKKADTGPHSPLGIGLALVGLVLMLVCGIMIIVEAFRASVLWGLGAIFVPFVKLIFVITHWSDTKTPFLVTYFVGLPLVVVSLFM